ncbi:MAG TPA: AAA family ATPase, partial [Nocardioidaceae bacterium]
MDHVVFQEKLRRPEPLGLSRVRLERQLLDDDGPSVLLVLAPPGSGKTTLLTHVAAAQAAPVAWYRTGPEDVSEAVFVRHVAEALRRAVDKPVDEPDPGVSAADAESTFGALMGLVDRLGGRPVLLVVDDVHELASTPAEAALERFLRLRPRSLRVLMGSRRPLTLNTPRLLVSGDFVEVD